MDLRRALDAGEIDVLFQPQVAIASGRITGVEALARWNHPAYGELGAATLFSVAERSDYLVQLSDHVQRKALEEAAAWPDLLGELRVAVNITAQDIQRPGFAGQFLAMLKGSGLDAGRVTVDGYRVRPCLKLNAPIPSSSTTGNAAPRTRSRLSRSCLLYRIGSKTDPQSSSLRAQSLLLACGS